MIIFLGVSGAGKGTQGTLLSKDTGYICLSVGELLRDHATPAQKEKMLEGVLLDDQEIIDNMKAIFRQYVDVNKLILDGFPRTLIQAQWLLEAANVYNFTFEAILHLVVSPETVWSRLKERGRVDDTPTAIVSRMAWYEQNTKPIIALYTEKKLPVFVIDGSGTTSQVQGRIKESLLMVYNENKS